MNFLISYLQKYFQLLKFLALPFFFLLLISTHIDQVLSETIESRLRNPNGADSDVWIFAGLSLTFSLFIPWLVQLIGILAFARLESKKAPVPFLKKNSEYLAIESLRAWGQMVLYSLLLILPGLWKFFQFQLLPWVVCLSKKYDQGQLDALKGSKTLFSKSKAKIILLCSMFLFVWPMIASSLFDQSMLFWISPSKSILYHALETMIHVLFIQIMTNIFVALLKESNDELIF